MPLNADEIKARLGNEIVIEPFHEGQLNTVSYDVTLGDHIARYARRTTVVVYDGTIPFVLEHDPIAHFLSPGERVLGHTREAIGGRHNVTTELRATSTAARIGVTICQCAGWGDVGYISRWTLEITNNTPYGLYLPVGAVLGQIVFHEVAPLSDKDYAKDGRYNAPKWRPEDMLPKKGKVAGW